jgi:hypothetical protein
MTGDEYQPETATYIGKTAIFKTTDGVNLTLVTINQNELGRLSLPIFESDGSLMVLGGYTRVATVGVLRGMSFAISRDGGATWDEIVTRFGSYVDGFGNVVLDLSEFSEASVIEIYRKIDGVDINFVLIDTIIPVDQYNNFVSVAGTYYYYVIVDGVQSNVVAVSVYSTEVGDPEISSMHARIDINSTKMYMSSSIKIGTRVSGLYTYNTYAPLLWSSDLGDPVFTLYKDFRSDFPGGYSVDGVCEDIIANDVYHCYIALYYDNTTYQGYLFIYINKGGVETIKNVELRYGAVIPENWWYGTYSGRRLGVGNDSGFIAFVQNAYWYDDDEYEPCYVDVYVSTDYGQTWNMYNVVIYDGYNDAWLEGSDITMDSVGKLYVYTWIDDYDTGYNVWEIFSSIDGGQTWTKVYTFSNADFFGLTTDGTNLYLSVWWYPPAWTNYYGSLLKSTDGGYNWTTIFQLEDYYMDSSIVEGSLMISKLYNFVGNYFDNYNLFYRSTDGGSNFTEIPHDYGLSSLYQFNRFMKVGDFILFDGLDSGRYCIVSEDAGATWSQFIFGGQYDDPVTGKLIILR